MPVIPASALSSAASPNHDGFIIGDYSSGLFHHDASESAIELLRYPELRDAAAGSLLCLLDCAEATGCVHRSELPFKVRDPDPAKPVIAQFALRVASSMGLEWIERHQVFERAVRFLRFYERDYVGLHGLFLTHSSLQSGFDSDLLTAGLPDKCVEGPDTNAFAVLEYEALSALASAISRPREADEFREKAELLRDLIRRLLWYEDENGGFFAALRWRHRSTDRRQELVGFNDSFDVFRPLESWTSLLPLYAGIPTSAQAKAISKKLLDPAAYWGPQGIRTLPVNSLFFNQAPRVLLSSETRRRGPVSNWSGPVWILSNYYLAAGLSRYGFQAEARELTLTTAQLLSTGLEKEGVLRESYDDGGRGLWPRLGTFISWNVLAITMLREFA